jgi:energy-coupling factor transporter ATP-binding protein EcfA2
MSLAEQIRKQLNTDIQPGADYFANAKEYQAEILTGVKWEVLKYGHRKLDDHCPYKQGQLTVVIGHTNVGKTTLILYLLSKLVGRKKLIIYSAENRVSQIARLLIAFCHGNHNYSHYFKWLEENVWFVRHAKQFNYKELLEQIAIGQDMGFDADMIFIDPYNSLKVDGKKNTHEYHYEAIEDMRIFTQTTKKSIFLNCHTVTEAQRVKPDQTGEIKPPLMGDVEGGAKFPNKADDVWVIHRNLYHQTPEERYISHLYIGKVRNTEGGGRPTGWQEPIRWKFKSDWTGFEQDEDRIAQYRSITEPKQEIPF